LLSRASTKGDKNTIVVFYTLENATDFDYHIHDFHEVAMSAMLRQQKSLSPFSDGLSSIDYPIFVPAKKRLLSSPNRVSVSGGRKSERQT
jgi:hypothetical protein